MNNLNVSHTENYCIVYNDISLFNLAFTAINQLTPSL